MKIATIDINGKKHDIISTKHATKRMDQRNVSKYVVAGNILSLGPETIDELYNNKDNAIIIDEVNNISVVVDFAKNAIVIVTVINKSNVFVKNNTQIVRL